MDRHALEQVLRRVDPAVRLVNERHLRRGLGQLTDLGQRVAAGLDHAHRLKADQVRQAGTFPAAVSDGDGDARLLMVEPGDRISGKLPDADILRVYWELLFEATVEDRLLAAGADRWVELGETATTEAKFRLRHGKVVPPNPTSAELYAAFVGEFLTLRRFAPEVLAYTYPSIDAEAVERLAKADVNADEVFARTRPDAAADPDLSPFVTQHPTEEPAPPPTPSAGAADRARRAAATGNLVRSAVLRARTGDPAAASALSEGLVPKLAKLFGWDRDEKQAWADALTAVLPAAARGYWSAAAMGLYDLQKIPIDLGQQLFAVDVAGWVRSLFRRPLVRKLTLARRSVLLRHLRAARGHFARLPHAVADPLLKLLDREVATTDSSLREDLRPVVREVLAGTLPAHHTPEAVARDTIAEELIDTICHRGHARLGDLRDAVARHALKLDDLTPKEFIVGDALLRADVALGKALDGLYQPGEVYLRAIQRGSSLAFGTKVGRWLTKFVVMPFGGAVMAVEFGKYIWHELGMLYGFVSGLVGELDGVEEYHDAVHTHVAPADKHHEMFTPPTVTAMVILGLFFLAVMHLPPFRAVVGRLFAHLGRVLKWVFVVLPLRVWNSPPVRAVRSHPVPRFVADRFGWPLVAGVGVGAALWALKASWPRVFWSAGGMFVVLAAVLNTPVGRTWQGNVAEALSDWWRWVRRDMLPNLVGFINWLFRELLGSFDRVIYSVDEWLRFREGQSKPTLAGKVVVAFLWFPVAYLWRFAFFLLIEPQVNPVKHFPVVTVSHKLLLPMVGPIADSTGLSLAVVGSVIWGIPGIFGFTVWELKENWRLYAANRPKRLRPLAIGHHGESVYGLLTPGFHSGTVPAAFEKARAALLRERHTGRPGKLRKAVDELHHAEEAVRGLVDRELLAVAHTATAWAEVSAATGAVHLGLQRVTIEVLFAGHEPTPTVIEFARFSGLIVGRVIADGALGTLTADQRAVWDEAMKGLLAKGAAADGPEWTDWVAFWNGRAG